MGKKGTTKTMCVCELESFNISLVFVPVDKHGIGEERAKERESVTQSVATGLAFCRGE